ncbi:glucosyl-3-phosphoglycerate synthase [Patulibacter sp. SYSU D01012]|uniref:glucosyl-3-phosphoglycerate synthase n=1 Tax=Patulibacter sp. SYSU D01012 TaxID=2817381 RepID=UPI001B305F7D|nr:glucosyl-3-phosphoglycerate synthase [Patulibacter sp. SYSU D01012]
MPAFPESPSPRAPRATVPAPAHAVQDREVATWLARRRHHHGAYPLERLASVADAARVSVVIPAKRTADTIGRILDVTVAPLVAAGVVDEVVVVDAASDDGTARVAAAHGARVVQESAVRPDVGPCRGKGDAMWRALHVTDGDVVAFLDADTADPDPAHLRGIVGPLLTDPTVAMVRGAFDRPYRTASGRTEPHGGGRVTELMARPLLNLHRPLLSGFRQPLAGEFAARRTLLEALPFPVGYGVEVSTLMDALDRVGLDALAEVDLGERQNRHQPLRDLGLMAYAVLCAVERRIDRDAAAPVGLRLPWEDGAVRAVPVDERPPVAAGRAATGPRDGAAAALAASAPGRAARPAAVRCAP